MEPSRARAEFFTGWMPLIWRPATDSIDDESILGGIEPSLLKKFVQHPPSRANKWTPLTVFVVSGSFSNDRQFCRRITSPIYHAPSLLVQRAEPTVFPLITNIVQNFQTFHNFLCSLINCRNSAAAASERNFNRRKCSITLLVSTFFADLIFSYGMAVWILVKR